MENILNFPKSNLSDEEIRELMKSTIQREQNDPDYQRLKAIIRENKAKKHPLPPNN